MQLKPATARREERVVIRPMVKGVGTGVRVEVGEVGEVVSLLVGDMVMAEIAWGSGCEKGGGFVFCRSRFDILVLRPRDGKMIVCVLLT